MMKFLAALLLLTACPIPVKPPLRFDGLAPGDHLSDGTAYHVLGAGPTCLALGGGGDWKALRSAELERQLQVVYVEPLPSGALATDVDQLERLRVVLHLDKLCVIGHARGGAVAVRYAIDHPDRAAVLVLYSATLDKVAKADAADLLASLPQLATPTLVVATTMDPKELATGIKAAKIETFHGTEHLVHVDEAAKFAQVVSDFAKAPTAPSAPATVPPP